LARPQPFTVHHRLVRLASVPVGKIAADIVSVSSGTAAGRSAIQLGG